tara:strand:+ start:1634 stop:2056 length:423 start_codon:yes stop_codon:yes gene_type:complete
VQGRKLTLKKNGIEITGDKEIDTFLKNLPAAAAKKIMRKGIRPAMKVLHKEVKNKVPVDEGQLKKAIKLKAAKRSRSSIGMDITVNKEDAFYAAMVEDGTKNRPPQSFIRSTADAHGEQALTTAKNGMKDIIREEAKKLK